MEFFIELFFKFIMYVFFGLSMEMIFSATALNKILGFKIESRIDKKYREGFVSLYMIPVHGLGLFVFELTLRAIQNWFILFRYIVWCILITLAEAVFGYIYKKVSGFYVWDYYKDSKYKIFKNGYSLWTLLPLWGFAGLIMEGYVKIIVYAAPHVVEILTSSLK